MTNLTEFMICPSIEKEELFDVVDGASATTLWVESIGLAMLQRFNSMAEALVFVKVATIDMQVMQKLTALKAVQPVARIVLLADAASWDDGQWARRSGLAGLLSLSQPRDDLRQGVERIRRGERIYGGERSHSPSSGHAPEDGGGLEERRAESEAATPRDLSEFECEILACLMEGLPNKMIASRWDVSEATVKIRLRRLIRKLGVANRTQAAVWAFENFGAQTNA